MIPVLYWWRVCGVCVRVALLCVPCCRVLACMCVCVCMCVSRHVCSCCVRAYTSICVWVLVKVRVSLRAMWAHTPTFKPYVRVLIPNPRRTTAVCALSTVPYVLATAFFICLLFFCFFLFIFFLLSFLYFFLFVFLPFFFTFCCCIFFGCFIILLFYFIILFYLNIPSFRIGENSCWRKTAPCTSWVPRRNVPFWEVRPKKRPKPLKMVLR